MWENMQDDDFPFPLTALDRDILSQTDEQFEPHTWDELKQIIAEHKLELLKRRPSDLRRYIRWSATTKAKYGSVPHYVMTERLKWTPLPPPVSDPSSESETASTAHPRFAVRSEVPFADPHDYAILPNDWPYGMAPGIRHLIVWLKTRLAVEPTRGDMTAASRRMVEDFVRRTFVERAASSSGAREEGERVMWFKNWTALQSVPGMEHVHVLVRDVPDELVLDWTGGEGIVQPAVV